jgi:hypothetical protein
LSSAGSTAADSHFDERQRTQTRHALKPTICKQVWTSHKRPTQDVPFTTLRSPAKEASAVLTLPQSQLLIPCVLRLPSAIAASFRHRSGHHMVGPASRENDTQSSSSPAKNAPASSAVLTLPQSQYSSTRDTCGARYKHSTAQRTRLRYQCFCVGMPAGPGTAFLAKKAKAQPASEAQHATCLQHSTARNMLTTQRQTEPTHLKVVHSCWCGRA